jgi:hypothetical protein
MGHVALGVPTPFADADSLAEVALARAELARALAEDYDFPQDLVAACLRWVEGRVAAGHDDLVAGLAGSLDFLAGCRKVNYHLTITPRAVKLAGVCQILLGNPAGAIEAISWLEELAPGVSRPTTFGPMRFWPRTVSPTPGR